MSITRLFIATLAMTHRITLADSVQDAIESLSYLDMLIVYFESSIPPNTYPHDLIDSFHRMVTLGVTDSHMEVFGNELKLDYVAVRKVVDAEFGVMPPNMFAEYYAHGGLNGVRSLPSSHPRAISFIGIVKYLENVHASPNPTLDRDLLREMVGWMMSTSAGEPLCRAAFDNDASSIKEILASPSPPHVDARCMLGNTALIFASLNGCLEAVQALLQAGADVDAQSSSRTALMHAADMGHLEIIQALLKAGALVDAQNIDGRTALMYTANRGDSTIIRALLRAGADVDAQSFHGTTALMDASSRGCLGAVQELLAAGANVHARCAMGRTALIHASIDGHLDVIRELMAAGANEYEEDLSGSTAFDIAYNRGHLEIADFLR